MRGRSMRMHADETWQDNSIVTVDAVDAWC